MYLDFYGLSRKPFQPTPDDDFLFLSPSHKEALASITYGTKQRKGFIVITGEVGVGKTTILARYLKIAAGMKQNTIHISNPGLTFERLLTTILAGLHVQPVAGEVAALVSQLQAVLTEHHREDSLVVLVVDEAQNIPLETLEGIRMLSNLETSSEKLIQIVLMGQPELETLLNRHELRAVKARIAVRGKILPLTQTESFAYVQHRLAQVSRNERSVFSKTALAVIVKTARGIPRRLNILCDNALITGFDHREFTISCKTAKEVVADLDGRDSSHTWGRWRRLTGRPAYIVITLIAIALPLAFYLDSWTNTPSQSAKLTPLEVNPPHGNVGSTESSPARRFEPDTAVSAAPAFRQKVDPTVERGIRTPRVSETATQRADEIAESGHIQGGGYDQTEEKADQAETARLLAVLLDSGRVVVGRAQSAINNPRLEDKGFSASVFEGQLRKEFLTRTGHDLRNLAPAPMPERAKPLLVRLSFFMQKAVQEVQTDINKKGIGFKGFIPATFGTKVADRFSKDTGLKLRQIGPPGIEPRNPDNKPDELEEHALVAIQRSHPRVGDHVVEQQLPDNKVRVLLPLFYNKQCLTCHGRPKGELDISGYEKEGFKEGDLGGAISVSFGSGLTTE